MKPASSVALRHRFAALAIAAAWLALPLPVLAQYHHGPPPAHYDHHYDHGHYDHYDHHDYHHGNDTGAVVAGALLGVAAGVAISNANTPQPPPTVVYSQPPPPPPPGVVYYDDGY
jgi:hypothetical protein